MQKLFKFSLLFLTTSLLTNSYLEASTQLDSDSELTPQPSPNQTLTEMKKTESSARLSISSLPLEILVQSFTYLDFKETVNIESVSKFFKEGTKETYKQKVSIYKHYWEMPITEDLVKTNKLWCMELYKALLSNKKLKSLNPYKTSPYSVVVTTDFLEPLERLQCLADQGSNKAMRKYFMRLEGSRKSLDLSSEIYERLKRRKAEYRDKIIEYYEKYLKTSSHLYDDKHLDYIEYKIANFIHYTNLDDQGNVRKKRFLELVRKLKEKQYGKASLLHYLVGGRVNKEYLEKSKVFEENNFFKITFIK